MRKWFFLLLLLPIGAFWYWEAHSYHAKIPMKLNNANIPIVEVSIHGSLHSLKFDLGSMNECVIAPGCLNKEKMIPYGTAEWWDIKGNNHRYPRYKIEGIALGCMQLKPVFAVEKIPEKDGLLYKNPKNLEEKSPDVGRIGHPLITQRNLLLDCPQRLIIFSNRLGQLKKEGYDFSKYRQVPLNVTPKGVFIEIEAGSLRKNFLIDTGFTRTFISDKYQGSASQKETIFYYSIAETFKIGGHDFGPKNLYYLDFPDQFGDIEAVLGMDFLLKHVVYLDFANGYAYIET